MCSGGWDNPELYAARFAILDDKKELLTSIVSTCKSWYHTSTIIYLTSDEAKQKKVNLTITRRNDEDERKSYQIEPNTHKPHVTIYNVTSFESKFSKTKNSFYAEQVIF